MRRPRVLQLLTVVGLAGLLAATGCGVLAEDTAATVGDTVIPASTVDALVRDTQFRRAMAPQADEDQRDGVIEGSSARDVLSFLISSEVLAQEADRWGVVTTGDDLEQAKASAEQQIDAEVPGLRGKGRDVVLRYLIDGNAVQQRLSKIDPSSDKDLRRLYDGVPTYWDQVCMTAVVVPADSVRAARAALADGTGLDELAGEVKGANLALTPQQCRPRSFLPETLVERIDSSRVGAVVGPVADVIDNDDSVVWFRVESKGRLSFEDAHDQLQELARTIVQQGVSAWLQIRVNERVTIDPQFGSGTSLSQTGLTVLPPALPLGTLPRAGGIDDVTGGAAGATP